MAEKTKRKIRSCGCDMFIPFGFSTNFLGLIRWHTVMCISCRKKARGRTLDIAIKNWNRMVKH